MITPNQFIQDLSLLGHILRAVERLEPIRLIRDLREVRILVDDPDGGPELLRITAIIHSVELLLPFMDAARQIRMDQEGEPNGVKEGDGGDTGAESDGRDRGESVPGGRDNGPPEEVVPE